MVIITVPEYFKYPEVLQCLRTLLLLPHLIFTDLNLGQKETVTVTSPTVPE